VPVRKRNQIQKVLSKEREGVNPPNPIPNSPQAWLEEIANAYIDARETIPFGPLVGQDIKPEDLFHLAPLACLKFRGLGRSETLRKKATEAALTSYVANQENLPDVFVVPQLAFAFAYLASHFGLDLLYAEAVNPLMEYVEEHQWTLLQLTEDAEE
jgi:hypothetical protein